MDRIEKGLFPAPRRYRATGGRCHLAAAVEERVLNPLLGAEAYRILITNDRIILEAAGQGGLFLASQTLRQIRLLSGGSCPCLEIEDEPELDVRGYMLDISRCKVPRMEQLFRLVDLLALFKYNQLQLYMEHAFAYQGHERVWAEASPMTPDEVRELADYCRDRHIELVPNQNAFGHMERWLRHPEYHHLAESPDGFQHPLAGWKPCGSTLAPGRDAVDFVDGLLRQLLPCFRSGWIHLGCDEPWELGQGRSELKVQEKGRHAVFLQHVRDLHALATGHGKHMLFWADELYGNPDLIRDYPADIIPVVWGYEVDHPFEPVCRTLFEEGHAYLVAPGDSTWNSFTGRLDTALPNIRQAIEVAVSSGAMGAILTGWGDNGHQQAWPTQIPPLLAFGALAWNRQSLSGDPTLDPSVLAEALDRLVFLDQNSTLGGFWCSLGRIDSGIPVKLNEANSSFPYDALYAPRSRLRHALRPLGGEALFPVISHLDSLERLLGRCKCHCADAAWILDEARIAAALARYGLKRADAVLKGNDPQSVLSGFPELVIDYETAWLRRNREGGLQESRDRLAGVLG